MKTILTLDGLGHDVEAVKTLLRDHGYNVGTVSESAWAVEQALYASEKRYRNLFDNAPVGMLRSTPNGRILSANPVFARILKYASPEALIHRVNRTSIAETIFADPLRRQVMIEKVLSRSEWQIFEERLRCSDDSIVTCRFHIRAVREDNGRLELEEFIEDVSKRKSAEDKLRLTQYVVDHTSDQAFWLDEEGRVVYVNEAACRALGYSREELTGLSIYDFDPIFSQEEFKRNWQKLRGGDSRVMETLHQAKDGRVYPVEVRVNHVEFDGRKYHCTFVTDISERKATEEILRQSEKRYRRLMEVLPIAAYTTDAEGRITFFNCNAAQLWGGEPRLNQDRWCGLKRLWYPDGRPMAFDESPMAQTLLHGKRFQGREILIERASGECAHVIAYPEPLYDAEGMLVGGLNLLVDISDRKQVERQLLQANLVVENSPVVLFRWRAEPGWPVVLVSKNITQFGYEPEEFLSGSLVFSSIIHPQDRARVEREVEVYVTRGSDRFEQEYRILGGGGKVRWVNDQTIVERDDEGQVTHYQGIIIDVTERKHAEERIKQSLAEKEVLIKEIHHRVKNNLQVVSSLLYLQSQKLHDPETKELFAESQNRICSMALAHEQLYQSKNLADISLREYVRNLVSQVQQTFMMTPSPVVCTVSVADIMLDIEKVVPCGLLITELLSNALKHAFPEGRSGSVKVEIRRQGRQVNLCVADDGIGLPENFNYLEAETLGLQLVCALVEQLNATMQVHSDRGACFDISFSG
jgi:PAS domain S-box-containing protein